MSVTTKIDQSLALLTMSASLEAYNAYNPLESTKLLPRSKVRHPTSRLRSRGLLDRGRHCLCKQSSRMFRRSVSLAIRTVLLHLRLPWYRLYLRRY